MMFLKDFFWPFGNLVVQDDNFKSWLKLQTGTETSKEAPQIRDCWEDTGGLWRRGVLLPHNEDGQTRWLRTVFVRAGSHPPNLPAHNSRKGHEFAVPILWTFELKKGTFPGPSSSTLSMNGSPLKCDFDSGGSPAKNESGSLTTNGSSQQA